MSKTSELKTINSDSLLAAFEAFEKGSRRRKSAAGKTRLWSVLLEHSQSLAESPQLDAAPQMVVLLVDEGFGMDQLSLLDALVTRFGESRVQFSELVETLMPKDSVPTTAVVEQARRNADARTRFFEDFPSLTSSEVADLSSSKARNRAALANSWRKQHRVFAVTAPGGQLRFPLFQFTADGTPKPVVHDVLNALADAGLDGWEVALWFTGASTQLKNRRPVDLIDDEQGLVVKAAQAAGQILW